MTIGQTAAAGQGEGSMPALAVHPGEPASLHLTTLPRPMPRAGEVSVRVRQVGVCGTDREIIEGHFGRPPEGSAELVIGHEVLGVVERAGAGVSGFAPGDLVTATVRRPDGCPACLAGQPDMCVWRRYTERGILGAHGFMAERFVEDARHLVPVPADLAGVGVLVEPTSVVEKGLRQANLIQRRLASWAPATALVLGAGPIGLLGTMLLRSRGMAVVTIARGRAPNPAAAVVDACGGRYVSSREVALPEVAAGLPPIDLIFEATGAAALAFEAMRVLGSNGVLVLLSLTGGDQTASIPIAELNREFVLGNKVLVGSVNSAQEDFEAGVADLGRFGTLWPGLTDRLITHRLDGFADYARLAGEIDDGIKTVVEFAG